MPFCDRKGNETRLETFSASFQHWIAGEALEEPYRAALDHIEAAFFIAVRQMDVRGIDFSRYLVLNVELEDGTRELVRVLSDLEPPEFERAAMKFESDIGVMRWLKAHCRIPQLSHKVVRRSATERKTFMAIEKMPADCILNAFRDLSQERVVLSYAEHALAMFRLIVPQGLIGTLNVAGDALNVIPRITIREQYCAINVYATLEDFVDALVDQKRRATSLPESAHAVIGRLVEPLPGIYSRLKDPSFRRCVLVHDDLNETNILADAKGDVTGIIDWEFHSIRPAVLAAQ